MIQSILDTDLYKFTQQWFVLQHYPDAIVEYQFNNRNKTMKFNETALNLIRSEIDNMGDLELTSYEYAWMENTLKFLPKVYLDYLNSYRFNPKQVIIKLDADQNLVLTIHGKWHETILWEVPLMAIISNVYFKVMDTDWSDFGQENKMQRKAERLCDAGCVFADFGTRRRRSYETQQTLVKVMSDTCSNMKFVGTSNPHLAMFFHVKALGTCAHESIGAVAAMESLNHPNKVFMEKWQQTYKGDLGIMLPDTYGIASFLTDFSLEKAKLWDGVRHDSGDPKVFTDKIIEHYKKLGINPLSKTIIFSDGLDVDTAISLNEYCKDKIKCSFGIGTNFTNDFTKVSDPTIKSPPLNMVIKLTQIDGIPVVKLSDTPGKAIGDSKMVETMKYIHFQL